MQLEISKKEKNSIGAIIFALNNCRWLNDSGEPMTGRESIRLNGHLSSALSFFNRMNEAEKGGLEQGEPAKIKKEEEEVEEVSDGA